MSLTETMEVLQKASMRPGFQYLKCFVNHIDLIANVPVRNVSLPILGETSCSENFQRKKMFVSVWNDSRKS